ncbi:MAG: hypothetical protein IKR78_03070 [Dehalococcoidales bacterium]|nr:hypothetical protein [Dehalococcoidales bacterium]
MHTEDLIELRNRLLNLLDKLERDYHGFWARIVKGDGIECFIPEQRYSLRIAVLLKLFVKMQADKCECSEMLQKYGIRFSIGMSRMVYENRKEGIIDGPAIYLSGRNLDIISHKANMYSIVEMDGAPEEMNCFLDSYVAMVSNLVDSYSVKKAEVVYYKLLGFKEREISERLGIFQSSVNTRSTNAQWGLLNTAIKDFENMKFEGLCG